MSQESDHKPSIFEVFTYYPVLAVAFGINALIGLWDLVTKKDVE